MRGFSFGFGVGLKFCCIDFGVSGVRKRFVVFLFLDIWY